MYRRNGRWNRQARTGRIRPLGRPRASASARRLLDPSTRRYLLAVQTAEITDRTSHARRREFAENHRPELEAIITALQESDAWIVAAPREAARFFVDDAQRRGGTADLDRWEAALRGRPFGVDPVTDGFLDEQRRSADLLHANGLLPRTVDVRAAVLPWIGEVVEARRSVMRG